MFKYILSPIKSTFNWWKAFGIRETIVKNQIAKEVKELGLIDVSDKTTRKCIEEYTLMKVHESRFNYWMSELDRKRIYE